MTIKVTQRAADLAECLNPSLFARNLDIEPDDWQHKVLNSNAPRIILNCSRQSGKSTVTSILALHHAIHNKKALVLLISPSLRQSQELFKKVSFYFNQLNYHIRPESYSALRIELPNGSRIVSLPGKETTIRGYSGVSLMIIDEASRVAEDTYFAIRPMLAVSHGRIILLSTPNKKEGFFYDAWTHGGDLWERYEIPVDQCPRISEEFLAEEREILGPLMFAQEYHCEFVDAVPGGIFQREWFNYYTQREFKELKFDEQIISCDLAFKDKSTADYTCYQCWGRTNADIYLLDMIVGQWDFPTARRKFVEFCDAWPDAYRKVIEDKAAGISLIQELKHNISGLIPYNPGSKDKVERANAVSGTVEARNVYLPEGAGFLKRFLDEVIAFPNAKNDDIVDAMSMALIKIRKSQTRFHVGGF